MPNRARELRPPVEYADGGSFPWGGFRVPPDAVVDVATEVLFERMRWLVHQVILRREALGWSQNRLSALLGVSRRTVASVEGGLVWPDRVTEQLLRVALDIEGEGRGLVDELESMWRPPDTGRGDLRAWRERREGRVLNLLAARLGMVRVEDADPPADLAVMLNSLGDVARKLEEAERLERLGSPDAVFRLASKRFREARQALAVLGMRAPVDADVRRREVAEAVDERLDERLRRRLGRAEEEWECLRCLAAGVLLGFDACEDHGGPPVDWEDELAALRRRERLAALRGQTRS